LQIFAINNLAVTQLHNTNIGGTCLLYIDGYCTSIDNVLVLQHFY